MTGPEGTAGHRRPCSGRRKDVYKRQVRAIAAADLLIVGGTSLTVYPAAGLLNYFSGKHLVLLNRDETGRDGAADLILRQPIGQVLGAL